MKISSLIEQLQKAERIYGDIKIGVYCQEYAGTVKTKEDLCSFRFRVLSENFDYLPGVSMDGEEYHPPETGSEAFGVFFYECES